MTLSTKQDFMALMHRFLDPIKPLYSAQGARLCMDGAGATYAREAIELEAFSRPLWALVPYWMGGGHDPQFEDIYRRGLAAGTDPESDEYWGGFSDYDQRFVEMAAIACGLLFAPSVLWDPLVQREKENLAKWLIGINEHFIPDCNWQFFRVLVNVALKKRGMPYSAEKLEESLQKAETYYLDGGWYMDGASCQRDYYIPFAMHYYGLVYAAVMEQEDPTRCARFKQRAVCFAHDFVYWFADDGAALPFGRSLTYRFAQAGFWSACLFAGVEPFPVSVMKGILVRHFEYWLRQDMTGRDGIFTVGYGYPNLIMAERYNAPGSPYWSMKTFLFMALADDHPFWTADAAPLPPLDAIKPLPEAAMLMQRRPGDVTAYVPGLCELYGHGHLPEKYSKFAYSTAFGFSVARSNLVLHEACPDSMLAFVPDGDDTVYVRKKCSEYVLSDQAVVSVWSPLPGITVTTTVTPTTTGHTRRHVIESSCACAVYDCGFAVEKFHMGWACGACGTAAHAENEAMGCRVLGDGPSAAGIMVGADPNTSILWRNTDIPAVAYRIEPGRAELFTTVETWVNRA